MDLGTLVRAALEEDVGPGDLTAEACVDADQRGRAEIRVNERVVIFGQEAAEEVFRQIDVAYEKVVPDGALVDAGTVIGEARGPLRNILTGERTALNFLMRLSGIASRTHRTVKRAGGLRVLDTRKTTPLHRALEKGAVRAGGGGNHRFGLYDGVLIKENHIEAAGGLVQAITRARAHAHHLLRVECEVERLDQIDPAIDAGVDALLLDNMDDPTLREAVARVDGRVMLEASGNLTPERVATLAAFGLDAVSMGGLIHQARWADLSLRVVEVEA